MGESYPMEEVDRAEHLYCVVGRTFDQVAEATGIAASTLKRWSELYGWQERKEKIRKSLRIIEMNKIEMRVKAAEKCIEDLAPQNVYAFAALETLAQKEARVAEDGRRKIEDGGKIGEVDRPALFIEDLKFIAEVLKEVNPEGLKVLAGSFDEIVSRFKAALTKGPS
jgi:transposase-like protein